ncbi:MAG: guanine deaminase [Acidiphilium sp.]|nr:guanine deaminase [Acidiphilium sp.]MDD4936289.1 guanine deaminase [Acidiphilium sp.]
MPDSVNIGKTQGTVGTMAVRANLIHTPRRGAIEAIADALIVVSAGTIDRVVAPATADHADLALAFAETGRLLTCSPHAVLLPGLVDLHVHAPQFPQLGTALDLPLDRWLQEHTFPLEARYADLAFAEATYSELVATLLANGTTTALYFATIHLPATQRLAEICLRQGQRALIGRVAMDHPAQCPDLYRDPSAAIAADETRRFIGFVRTMAGNGHRLIHPVITPRFIPACTDELLAALGALAGETSCHVQTHCSEGDWEHGHVHARCGCSDTTALDRFGLLGRRTILAHGNFIDSADMDLIAARGAGIAHCPLSNAYLADAVFPLRAALDRGVHVGIGTDIAGGPSASVLENARHAVTVSRMLEDGVNPDVPRAARGSPSSRIDFREAFYLATAGGGIALDLPIGVFAPGYQFDALLIDPATPASNLRIGLAAKPDDALQRIVYTAQRADISEVWVAGMRVAGVSDHRG